MTQRTWFTTGVSSGFGRQLAGQLLARGDRVVGTVRIIQLSSYGEQVAFPGSSMYHATKWGIEGFAEAIAPEVVPFGIGITIVEPGGARTEFRYGSAQVAAPIAAYDATPAHDFRARLDPHAPATGDPARMATAIIDSAGVEPVPLRLLLAPTSGRADRMSVTKAAQAHHDELFPGSAALTR